MNPKKWESFQKEAGDTQNWESVEDWFNHYESETYYGIGAFLHDVIKQEEKIQLDLSESTKNGVCVGIFVKAPWGYDPSVKNISCPEFKAIINKYVSKITNNDEAYFQWWDMSAEA